MKIVIVDGDLSYPMTSGKRLRTWNLMVQSARRQEITYIARNNEGDTAAELVRQKCQEHGITPIIVNDPLPAKSGLKFFGRLAVNLFSKLPYSVTAHSTSGMRSAINQFAAQYRIDLWQFEWPPYMYLLNERSDDSAKVLVAHNVDSLIWERYYRNARGFAKRSYLLQQWHRFQTYEKRAFRDSDMVIAVSEPDAKLIRTDFSMPDVRVVDNGIDPSHYLHEGHAREPNTILFLGALDWRPNMDAIHVLLDDIFPKVRQQIPEAKLKIVGRRPGSDLVRKIDSIENAMLYADVPDVRSFLSRVAVMVVPLRIGGGSRLKILEALASAQPVVSTSVGAEGLNLTPGKDYVLAEIPEMAGALVDVLRHPKQAQAQAENGQAVVVQNYDWRNLAHIQEEAWQQAMALAKRRK